MFTQNWRILRNSNAQNDWGSKQFPTWQTYYTCIRNQNAIKKICYQVLLIDIKIFSVLKFLYVNLFMYIYHIFIVDFDDSSVRIKSLCMLTHIIFSYIKISKAIFVFCLSILQIHFAHKKISKRDIYFLFCFFDFIISFLCFVFANLFCT